MSCKLGERTVRPSAVSAARCAVTRFLAIFCVALCGMPMPGASSSAARGSRRCFFRRSLCLFTVDGHCARRSERSLHSRPLCWDVSWCRDRCSAQGGGGKDQQRRREGRAAATGYRDTPVAAERRYTAQQRNGESLRAPPPKMAHILCTSMSRIRSPPCLQRFWVSCS